ncbi:MAG TPA: thermonuclease family protein, partial [Acidimicrobiales bacterium]|nr:thermonuclease family protein [Acidimicrobiales bacterium]
RPGSVAPAIVLAIILVGCGGSTRTSAPEARGFPSPSAPSTVFARPSGVPPKAQAAVVERVVDGDTFWARVDEPGGVLPADATHEIRVLEIDTPETVDPRRPVGCYGPEASAFTKAELAVGSTVYLLPDKEDRDRYGRFLRYVWEADGEFFNDKAVRLGYAKAALYMPNDRFIAQLRAAELEAKGSKRGLWGACPGSTPSPTNVSSIPPAPTPSSLAPAVYFRNCSEARAAGAAPLRRGGPGYRDGLDGDRDGMACE